MNKPVDQTERAKRIAALNYDYAAQPTVLCDTCNLCGADDWTVITHRDRYGFPAQSTACNRCGLVALNPRMTPEAYTTFYERMYRPLVSAFHCRTIDAKTVKADQQIYADEMQGFMTPFLHNLRNPAFLDVGGSTGVVAVALARAFGLRPTVLDPAPDELAEASAVGLEVVRGFVETWNPGARRFGAVGLFQTIDHLLDITATLRKIRSIIEPDGIFVADIVDFRAAYLKNWSVEAATKIDHPFALTEDTASLYLRKAGFSVRRRAYSADHHLVTFVCRPCSPEPNASIEGRSVVEFLRELRFVQTAPRPADSSP